MKMEKEKKICASGWNGNEMLATKGKGENKGAEETEGEESEKMSKRDY
jgi:hypothetical protein